MSEGTRARFDLDHVSPAAFRALHQATHEAEEHARGCGLDRRLIELVRLRASQLNGCRYCLALHTKQALKLGESEERLAALSAWPGSTRFTDAERAALRLAESITRLDGGAVPDADYLPAKEHFDDKQLVGLVWTVALINTYNRLAITMTPAP